MAAPEYVPINRDQQPRRGLGLPPARGWVAGRPGELHASQPDGPMLGHPGPDQGYGLKLARAFVPLLELGGVDTDDAVTGCLGVGLRRASHFGRAPVVHDFDIAFRVWGFLGDAPPELVALRAPLFQTASLHYSDQRAIVDHVPESTLRLTHGEVARRFPSEWRALLGLDGSGAFAA
jgi:hypothetical protein